MKFLKPLILNESKEPMKGCDQETKSKLDVNDGEYKAYWRAYYVYFTVNGITHEYKTVNGCKGTCNGTVIIENGYPTFYDKSI